MEETQTQTQDKSKVFWLTVVGVVLVAGVLSFYYTDFFGNKAKNKSAELSNKSTTTMAQTKAILEDNVVFPEKELKSSTPVNEAELDREVSFFIPSGVTSLEANAESYKDGTNGWSLNYKMNKNLLETYQEIPRLSKTAPFEVSYASRANLASIISTESPKYRVKIVMGKEGENVTKVAVNIQEKK